MARFDLNIHPHRRLNILTGEWILVAPQRMQRPWQGQVENHADHQSQHYDPSCYLCPGNKRANGEMNLMMLVAILKDMAESLGEIRLIIDGTPIGFVHQLLIVTVAYRRRAISIAWTWIRCSRGHSSACKQLALLSYVRNLLPKGLLVLLVGDSEFGSVDVLKTLKRWRWIYVLRQKGNHQIKLLGWRQWQRFDALITKPGQSLWLGPGYLTYAHNFKVNLFAYWKIGEKEPWLLATNLSTPQATLAAYRRRMWIEEMFGDLKAHGFDLERTHLRHFMRLSRLTLAVALLYVWLVAFGSQVIKTGIRRLVDRVDRRDLSLFRIGYRMIQRHLTNELALSINLVLSG